MRVSFFRISLATAIRMIWMAGERNLLSDQLARVETGSPNMEWRVLSHCAILGRRGQEAGNRVSSNAGMP